MESANVALPDAQRVYLKDQPTPRDQVFPATELPEDIVREIFIAAMPRLRDVDNGMSPKECPLLLCQICSAWRHLAFTTPRLWASLRIRVDLVDIYAPDRMQQLADKVTQWLSRSGALPLSISFYSQIMGSGCDVSPLFSALAAFSSRWKDIEVAPPFSDSLETLSQLSVDKVPMLTSVSLEKWCEGVPLPCHLLPLLTAPSLRSLCIVNEDNLAALQLHWPNLTHLALLGLESWTSLNIHTILAILGQCSQLETCELDLTGFNDDDDSTLAILSPVSLLHLRRLTVSDAIGPAESSNLFMNLQLPDVRSLTYIGFSKEGDPGPPSHMLYPSLEHLSLSISGLLTSNLISALQSVPSLCELGLYVEPVLPLAIDFQEPSLDPGFLDHFTNTSGPLLLPNLSRLRLEGLYAVSDNSLLHFIESRSAAPGSKLVHIAAQFERLKQGNIEPLLAAARASGMKIQLLFRRPSPPPSIFE
ncbi:hypothetical protein B0H19DRAFT_281209 [Mycena capillaripes]|nr:hypothetical protein B0H19DRAFT_281209 [Mycena capillaripes]